MRLQGLRLQGLPTEFAGAEAGLHGPVSFADFGTHRVLGIYRWRKCSSDPERNSWRNARRNLNLLGLFPFGREGVTLWFSPLVLGLFLLGGFVGGGGAVVVGIGGFTVATGLTTGSGGTDLAPEPTAGGWEPRGRLV